ncbi:MAG: hypoxanthine phosphoribosyltransferase [Dehalococcoidales bacterium]|nr:MAG: hypoxanthine phosphoribosyltransferase [Dehalococcoidales bacterium]
MNTEHRPEVLISSREIATTIDRLATEISRDYLGKEPLLLGILKGSFMFMADLIRRLDFQLEVDFVRLSSYGRGTESSGKIQVVQGLRTIVRDREVLVIEDIIDTGLTVAYLLEYLRKKRPASLRLCTLLDKPSRRRVPVPIDYLGTTIPDRFLVGYGLDYDERFRNLPDVCVLEDNE